MKHVHRSVTVTRIGIVGTGYVGRGITMLANSMPDLAVTRVLTRRSIPTITDFPIPELLTNSIDEVIDHADLIVECSGDVLHATNVVDKAFKANLPVVTMNSEFQITAGSFFINKGYLTEAEGEPTGQPRSVKGRCSCNGLYPTCLRQPQRIYEP